MTDFGSQVRAFGLKVEGQTKNVFVQTAVATKASIVEGSSVTGAPGQPVDTGALRASWQLEFTTPTSATIATNLEYAPIIEDGVRDGRALTLRSQVGGWGSVRATVLNFDRLVQATVEEAR